MDPSFAGLPNILDDIIVDGRPTSPNYNQYPDLLNDYQFNIPSPDLNFFETPFLPPDQYPSNFSPPITVGSEGGPDALSVAADGLSPPSMDASPGGHSSSDDSEFSETVIEFMSQILMEENLEDKPCMFYDPLGLQVTEKSFYDALGQKYPPSPNQYQPPPYNNGNVETPEDVFSESSGNNGTGTTSISASTSTSSDPLWMGDVEDSKSSFPQSTLSGDSMFQLNLESNGGSKFLANPSNGVPNYMGGGIELLAQNIFKDSETLLQFRRGLEEASRFLPRGSQLVMDLEKNMASQECKGQDDSEEKGERENSSNGLRGRKNSEREDNDREAGRSNKQSAVQSEEIQLSEMFEDALSALCSNTSYMKNKASKTAQANGQPQGANGGKSRGKKQGKKKDTVDLNTLLVLCAQSVSACDSRTSNELLKQIRQHSSPFGDGSQRLAHFFANGLEARLAGTGTGTQLFYTSLASKKNPASEKLRAYKLHLSSCPFQRISVFFAVKMINKVAEKATTHKSSCYRLRYPVWFPVAKSDRETL